VWRLIRRCKNRRSIISKYCPLDPEQLLWPNTAFGRHLQPQNLISLVIVTHSPTVESLNPHKPSKSHPHLSPSLACIIPPTHHFFFIFVKIYLFSPQINLIRRKACGESTPLLLSSSISHSFSGSLSTDWLHGKWSGNFPFCSEPFMFQMHAHWGTDVHIGGGGGKQLTGLLSPQTPCFEEKRMK